jgi:uncharacterized HAD superfamily protein
MKQINKFSEITIIRNSLVVFDIDETLIRFDGINFHWWTNNIAKYYNETLDHWLSEQICLKEWKDIIEIKNPELVDDLVHDFILKLKENNCHIILLTARDKDLQEITYTHLSHVKLYFEHIYFNNKKGEELYNIFTNDYQSIENIIVIDDMKRNLDDIANKFADIKINLHLYNII